MESMKRLTVTECIISMLQNIGEVDLGYFFNVYKRI